MLGRYGSVIGAGTMMRWVAQLGCRLVSEEVYVDGPGIITRNRVHYHIKKREFGDGMIHYLCVGKLYDRDTGNDLGMPGSSNE